MLPENALPIPRFPIEGIFTRTIDSRSEDDTPLKFPIRFVETSTPGLRGQSGGPTVDARGTIWAIQSKTAHLPLGFSPPVPGNSNLTEHQFLNVGIGIHPVTLFAFFNEQGIKFQISEY
jgi:S1-C subfamily serine protease